MPNPLASSANRRRLLAEEPNGFNTQTRDASSMGLRSVNRNLSGAIVGGRTHDGQTLNPLARPAAGGMAWLDQMKAKSGQTEVERAPAGAPVLNPGPPRTVVTRQPAVNQNPLTLAETGIPPLVKTASGNAIGAKPFIAPDHFNGLRIKPDDAESEAREREYAGVGAGNSAPPAVSGVTQGMNSTPPNARAGQIRNQLVTEGRLNPNGTIPNKPITPPQDQNPHGQQYLNQLANVFKEQTSAEMVGKGSGAGYEPGREGDTWAKQEAERRLSAGRAGPDMGSVPANARTVQTDPKYGGPGVGYARQTGNPLASPGDSYAGKGDPYDSRTATVGSEEERRRRRTVQASTNPLVTSQN